MRQVSPDEWNWQFHSRVIRPIIAKLIQISADVATPSYMEGRRKSVGQGKKYHVAGNYLAVQKGSVSFDTGPEALAVAAAGTCLFNVRSCPYSGGRPCRVDNIAFL
jgi:hypothetical protein